jgi:hypothetical protein
MAPEERSLDDLVVLIGGEWSCNFKPLSEVSEIKVDLKKGTWEYVGTWRHDQDHELPIGSSRSICSRGTFSQPIAVYNNKNMTLEQLRDIATNIWAYVRGSYSRNDPCADDDL